MFRGRFTHTIDDKNRVSIPSKFREILTANYDERLILTNFDGCLWGYPYPEWLKIEERVAALPQFKPEVKALQRVFISAATECPIDKQGRILIPPTLLEYADIKRELIFVGLINRIEVWASEKWAPVFEESQKSISEQSMQDKLSDLGL